MQPSRITIGTVPFDCVTLVQAIDAVDGLVAAGTGGFVVTPNVDHVVLARRDARLRHAHERTRLSLADGQPVLWISRLLGTALPEKVSGSDLIEPLMERAAERGWRVFFVGGTAAVSAEAECRLRARWPALQVVGRDTSRWAADGAMPTAESDVVKAIRRTRADLVVVALGCPKQEYWMTAHERLIAPAVALGLGGSLDFVAGAVRRAPSWMSAAGLEWLYRLGQEPRRLAYRYLVRDMQVLPIFAAALVRAAAGRMHAAPERS